MNDREILPRKYFIGALIFTVSLVAGLCYKLWDSHSIIQTTQSKYLPIVELSGIVLKVDEKINHIVYKAVYSEQPEIYQEYLAFINAFRSSHEDLKKLLSSYDKGFDHGQMDRSDVVEIEEKVFVLLRDKQHAAARELLESDTYFRERSKFLEAAQGMTESLSQSVSSILEENDSSLKNSFIVLVGFLFLSFGLWVFLLRTLEANIKARNALSRQVEDQRAKSVETARLVSLGEMAGGIAHEINNPLAIIEGRAHNLKSLINREPLNMEKVDYCVNSIMGTTQRIYRIVRSLLTIARSGDDDDYDKVVVKEIVDDALELVGRKLSHHEIDLKVNGETEVYVECRFVQISQVLLNLLQNAFHAVEKLDDRWIHIDVNTAEDSTVCMSVTDAGGGIPEEMVTKIMQPFFTTKEIGKGTGLGLSISKSIVEQHGGKFYVDQKCPNTRFVIELPLATAPKSKNVNSSENKNIRKSA